VLLAIADESQDGGGIARLVRQQAAASPDLSISTDRRIATVDAKNLVL
jgi:hypothetical protein